MTRCTLSRELLQAFVDGQLTGQKATTVEGHVAGCALCQNQVAAWRGVGQELRRAVDAGVGEVDTLAALARIRTRIAAREQDSLAVRLKAFWRDLFMFHRRALVGVAVAAAVGALLAPALVYVLGRVLTPGSRIDIAGVVIEKLETENDTRAVIFRPGNGSTTVIWMEPNAKPGDADDSVKQQPEEQQHGESQPKDAAAPEKQSPLY